MSAIVFRALPLDRTFPVWKTIEVRVCSAANDCAEALKSRPFWLDDEAKFLLKHRSPLLLEPQVFNLVRVTGEQLGQTHECLRSVVYRRAKFFGLMPCPLGIVPLLRTMYIDQPPDESLLIATYSQLSRISLLRPFCLFEVGRWTSFYRIFGNTYSAEHMWSPDIEWVFVQSSA